MFCMQFGYEYDINNAINGLQIHFRQLLSSCNEVTHLFCYN